MMSLVRAIFGIPFTIMIIGIAAAILLPPYQEYIERSKQYTCDQDPNDPICEELKK